MTIQEFFNNWNGRFNDYDHTYGPQCKDLFSQYNNDILGNKYIVGNPVYLWNNFPKHLFKQIKNTPFNSPKLGDIVIWSMSQTGHIAICQSGNLISFISFDQNWPVQSPCHFQKHNYKGVLGWLRPIPVMVSFPKVPLKIARIGVNLPNFDDFNAQVAKFSSSEISCASVDYNANTGNQMNQDKANAIVDQVNPQEKFVSIFYTPVPGASYYYFLTFSHYKRDCIVTICPAIDPRLMAFEFAHAVQIFYNEHRGSLPPVDVVDMPGATGPSDDLIRAKYDTVSKFYK